MLIIIIMIMIIVGGGKCMKENWKLVHKGNDPFAHVNMLCRKKELTATHGFMGFKPPEYAGVSTARVTVYKVQGPWESQGFQSPWLIYLIYSFQFNVPFFFHGKHWEMCPYFPSRMCFSPARHPVPCYHVGPQNLAQNLPTGSVSHQPLFHSEADVSPYWTGQRSCFTF